MGWSGAGGRGRVGEGEPPRKESTFDVAPGLMAGRENSEHTFAPLLFTGSAAAARRPHCRPIFCLPSSVYWKQSASCLFSLTTAPMMSMEKPVAEVVKYTQWRDKDLIGRPFALSHCTVHYCVLCLQRGCVEGKYFRWALLCFYNLPLKCYITGSSGYGRLLTLTNAGQVTPRRPETATQRLCPRPNPQVEAPSAVRVGGVWINSSVTANAPLMPADYVLQQSARRPHPRPPRRFGSEMRRNMKLHGELKSKCNGVQRPLVLSGNERPSTFTASALHTSRCRVRSPLACLRQAERSAVTSC